MSPERQIGTSPGRSNEIFRKRPGGVERRSPGTLKGEVLGTSWETIFAGWEIRGGICHFINRDAQANNRYIENYNKNKELPLLKYLDLNNLYLIKTAGK